MNRLDIAAIELKGTHLIEASAGTGKTYTVGLLVLRLVLETELKMPTLALVTFTEAAAAELAERIIGFLEQARRCIDTPQAGDPVSECVQRAVALKGKEKCHALLERSAMELELARITTIHGFCTRLLGEFAFELGAGGGYETIPTEAALIEEILADFWRNEIATLTVRVQPLVSKITPQFLREELRELLNFPGVVVKGPSIDPNAVAQMFAAYEALARTWRQQRTRLLALLTECATRFDQRSYKVDKMPAELQKIDELFESGSLACDQLTKFSYERLVSKISKKAIFEFPAELTIIREISSYCQRFALLPENLCASLIKRAFEYLVRELSVRKAKLRVRSFNDLIAAVARGLEKNGEEAALPIRSRFKAVLVDEFQDTDRLQYQIFSTLFEGHSDLFFAMVGDPKQAIYRFRGGDIATYLAAKKQVTLNNCHTLYRNFRSVQPLLNALGLIYQTCKEGGREPFRTPKIAYEQVETGNRDLAPATLGGAPLSPVTIWRDSSGRSIDRALIARAVAAQICTLVNNVEIGEMGKRRSVGLGDIAILVGANRSAEIVKQELAACGIRAVSGKSGSVFESPEAEEIALLCAAILAPSDGSALRALLLSGLFNFDLKELEAWERDNERRTGLHAMLESCRRMWPVYGAARALDLFLLHYDILCGCAQSGPATLAYERRMTNMRHLIEIIHAQDERVGRIPQQTVAAFAALRRDTQNEEYEQRLESDSTAVQIVTMHKAKGLQWPVVFAIELWTDGLGGARQKRAPLWHVHNELVAEFDPARRDEIDLLTQEQLIQERQRLAYVTLTRAESLLYIVTGGAKKDSPAEWLLHGPHIDTLANENTVTVSALTDPGHIVFAQEQTVQPSRTVEAWTGETYMRPRWEVGSYSGLTRGQIRPTGEMVAFDIAPSGIFAFPRGAAAGTVLHTIFEKVDFMSARGGELHLSEQEKIGAILARNGFDSVEFRSAVITMVSAVLDASLIDALPDFSLSCLARSDRSSEMEFNLSAAHPSCAKEPLTAQKLTNAVGGVAGSINPNTRLAGFLTGVIDLVFTYGNKWYLLDWKSNHLGNCAEAYTQQAIVAAMDAHNYHLQYLLYTVALCRYLRLATNGQFDYAHDFGGAIYLFVRGVDGSRDTNGRLHGVFHAKPDLALIEKLEELL